MRKSARSSNWRHLFYVAILAAGALCPSIACQQDAAVPFSDGHDDAVFDTISLRKVQNVVVILIDTLRQDRLSAYGYERQTSPVIDRIAAEGAMFDGRAPSSWTRPSTASVLTGLHPIRHQTYDREDVLPDSAATLAELVAESGRMSIGVSANLHITRQFGFHQGFSVFKDMGELGFGHVADAKDVTDVTISLLGDLTEPYLLYVHYVDPHVPYDPPYGWDGEPLPRWLTELAPISNEDIDPLSFAARDPDLVRAASELYDGEVRDVDQQIGRLLDELEGRGLTESTLVIVTADHGEEFEEHGRMGHGHSLYGEIVRVPLIFHAPGVVPPGLRLGKASLMDIVPTVLELLSEPGGSVESNCFDGRSLVPTIFNRVDAVESGREFLFHHDYNMAVGLAFESESRKLILTPEPYEKALYDLKRDPGEQEALGFLKKNAKQMMSMAERLANRHNQLGRIALRGRTDEIDAKLNAQLVALGYVDAPADRRRIPAVIGKADLYESGLLGWPEVTRSCVSLESPAGRQQWLNGWHEANDEAGMWSRQKALVALKAPAGGGPWTLVITGHNHRPDRPRVRVQANGRRVGSFRPDRGTVYRVELGFDRLTDSGEPVVIKIEVDPLYYPADHGSPDTRSLGLFVEEMCLH